MDKILRGILKYNKNFKTDVYKELSKFHESNAKASSVFFTCIDCRLMPSVFTQSNVGDMFVVRNVGNMIPPLTDTEGHFGTEISALELSCLINGIKHVIVSGHSDCKAINLLHSTFPPALTTSDNVVEQYSSSPITMWMHKHGCRSMNTYRDLEKNGFKDALTINDCSKSMETHFANIDVDNSYCNADKLSMINTLLQMENVSSFKFMSDLLTSGEAFVHALWFDVHSANTLYFSRLHKKFLVIDSDNMELIQDDLRALGVPNDDDIIS